MLNYILTILLLLLSALFSGLNLGLMSLGPYELKRKIELGDKRAKKIYSIRKDGNLLLVTLLLGNVAVNAGLSVFLGSLTTGLIAVVVATALITVFGEIIPQAVLSRYAMEIGSRVVGIVKVFIFLLYPLSKPIAWMLDKVLGEELPTIYSKKELVDIIREHSGVAASGVQAHEEKIASGALTFGEKTIREVMTPRKVVMFLDADKKLTTRLANSLRQDGHTRYPVYKENQDKIVGVLYIQDLLTSNMNKPIGEVAKKSVIFVNEESNLDEALITFTKARQHMAVVVNNFSEVVGVITMEDVLEEILQTEIVDEFDRYDDMRAVARRKQ